MNNRLPILGAIAVLAATTLLGYAVAQTTTRKQAVPSGSRIRIVVQSSEQRLEDIQESLDGTRLITHDRGFAPRLWENKSHRLLALLGGHSDPVDFVTFSPDGKLILTLAANEIRIWDSLKARSITRIPAPKEAKFTAAAFSDDSQKIAAGTDKGRKH